MLISLTTILSLISLFSYQLLRTLFTRQFLNRNLLLGKTANTIEDSLRTDAIDSKTLTLQRQRKAMQDYFRDTGGNVQDLRVLRSAMYLSDEIDRAVRQMDIENQNVGWRRYNLFFAEGTEDLFTNVPSGKSPLVLAKPNTPIGTNIIDVNGEDEKHPLPIEYQSARRAFLKQVGRNLDQVEERERNRLLQRNEKEDYRPMMESFPESVKLRASEQYQPEPSTDLRVSFFQPYEAPDRKIVKEKLRKFEGEITDRKPFEDYRFEQ